MSAVIDLGVSPPHALSQPTDYLSPTRERPSHAGALAELFL